MCTASLLRSDLGEKNKIKSSFETRQERLNAKIKHLEEELLAEKPWQLKGEVTAKGRPENALLEEDLEFDQMTREGTVNEISLTRNLPLSLFDSNLFLFASTHHNGENFDEARRYH